MLALNIILFIIACSIMVLSGSFLIKSLTKIAAFLRMHEFVVGFIIMAFSTSVPELFVGITSAFAGDPSLSLGNVIGANIANMTLIIGIIIILSRGMNVKSKTIKKDALFMVLLSALPIILKSIGRNLSRVDGAILLLVFLIYIKKLMKQGREFHKEVHAKRMTHIKIATSFLIFFASIGIVFLSADFVVKYATEISLELALPSILVGLFVVSIGTTLPELTFGMHAVLKKHPEMALGDTIGSVVANSTLVLGVVSLIHPIQADFKLFLSSGIFMIIISFLFATFTESENKLSIKEGIALILFYVFFIMIEFYISSIGG